MKSNIHDFPGFSSLKTVFSENYFYSASNSGSILPLEMLNIRRKKGEKKRLRRKFSFLPEP
jgi:hypothetical protein